jgi:HD-GYP domain-containing protein (c-di-GMP phosphodiesterase class II)
MAEQAGKRRVVVIDGHDAHRQQVATALRLFYEVNDFEDAKRGLASVTHAPPALVVIDESVAEVGNRSCIAVLRQLTGAAKIPVVLTGARGGTARGADLFLEKPFRRSVLWRAVSDLISTRVEQSWQALPARPATILRKTVQTFNQVADGIARGEPIAFAGVKDACEPLVEAVASQDYLAVLEGVRGHDNQAYTHALRVGTLLSAFGHAIGLRGDDLATLAAGGLLHDVGLLSVAPEIRFKAGAMTPQEEILYRAHVGGGAELLQAQGDVPKGVLGIALQHHEKLDGTGYPGGLSGNALNDLVRMAALVDVFVELTDEEPGGKAMAPEEALKTMRVAMKRTLDTRLVGLFAEMLLDTARSGAG